MFAKLDKDHFIKSFIDSQKHHAPAYAADGKDQLATWDRQTSRTPEKQKSSATQDFGFDTPVLKPRAANPRYESAGEISDTDGIEDAVDKDKKLRSKKSSNPEGKHKKKAVTEPSSKSNKENMRHPPSIPKSKPISKKRPIRAESDDEHAARKCSSMIFKGL